MSHITLISTFVFAANFFLFVFLLALSFFKMIRKDKLNLSAILPIVRWCLLGILLYYYLFHAFYFFKNNDISEFIERMRTRPAFLIMIIGDFIAPFILLNRKANNHLFMLLFASFAMNIGRMMGIILLKIAVSKYIF